MDPVLPVLDDVKIAEMRDEVQQTRDSFTQKISLIKDSITEKVESVTKAGQEVVTNVQKAFDIKHHAEEHPWVVMGVSVAAGFVLGKVLMPHMGGPPSFSSLGDAAAHPVHSAPHHAATAYSPPSPPAGPKIDLFASIISPLIAHLAPVVTDAAKQAITRMTNNLLGNTTDSSTGHFG